ncbi:hypothetical protein Pelo_2851 [Pelomyxa schiedti]|nr:hypothetical protein Pelo_2851 [Pelomyxa schiedti]
MSADEYSIFFEDDLGPPTDPDDDAPGDGGVGSISASSDDDREIREYLQHVLVELQPPHEGARSHHSHSSSAANAQPPSPTPATPDPNNASPTGAKTAAARPAQGDGSGGASGTGTGTGTGSGGGGGHHTHAYTLSMSSHNYDTFKRQALSSAGSAPFVISLIGGKSENTTLVKPLLLDDFNVLDLMLSGDQFSPDKHFSGTSANVCLYRSTPQPDPSIAEYVEKPVIYVLDLEGQNAVGVPTMLQRAVSMFRAVVPNKLHGALKYMLQDAAGRRQAVNKLLPLFAYFVSDLVVYIDNTTFDNTKFIERIKNFVSCIGGIADKMLDPSLIIISNKCAMKGPSTGVWDIDECTKKFFRSQDGQTGSGLSDLHQSVRCVCLPDWNAGDLQYVDGKLISSPIGAIKYAEQIGALQKLLHEMHNRRLQERFNMGLHISERTWLEVLKLVVDDFPSSSQIQKHTKALTWSSKFYSIVASPSSEEVKTVNALFSQLVCIMNHPIISTEEYYARFLQCRDTATISLAGKIALLVKQHGLSSVQSPAVVSAKEGPTPAPFDQVRSQWLKMLHELMEHIEDQRPCSSCYHRVDSNNTTSTIRCTQTKKWHQHTHRNPTPLFGPEASQTVVQKFFLHLASFLGLGFPAVWPGNFESAEKTLPVDEENFLAHLRAFLEMDEESVICSVCEQLGNLLADYHCLPTVYRIREFDNSSDRQETTDPTANPTTSTQASTSATTTPQTTAPPTSASSSPTSTMHLCTICLREISSSQGNSVFCPTCQTIFFKVMPQFNM